MPTATPLPAPITVGSVLVRQYDGLYALSDLHKASGGKPKHKPVHFLANEHTKALIEALSAANVQTLKTVRGRGKEQGTYACAELAAAYAAWISLASHMQVIRVFLAGIAPVSSPLSMRTLTFTIPQNEVLSARWLLHIDHHGNERCLRLSEDTHVLTRERLVRVLIQNPADLHMSLEERLSILAAILRNLSQAAALSARRLHIKPV